MALPQQLRAIKNLLRNVIARETLDEAPPAPGSARRTRFVSFLLEAEPLGSDPEPPRPAPARGLIGALFAREVLPEDLLPPPVSAAAPGLLHALFAPEALPDLPQKPPRPRRSHWLRWLFSFERLDPP